MPAVQPNTAFLSRTIQLGRELVAASAKFQDITGAVDAEAALDHVFAGAATGSAYPRATVKEKTTALRLGKFAAGVLEILFEIDITDADAGDTTSELFEFDNALGIIVQEMREAADDTSVERLYVPQANGIRLMAPSAVTTDGSTRLISRIVEVSYGLQK